nr:hypothetical protein [Tanacetum cinerariifolium]
MAAPGGNQLARRFVDDLIEFSGQTSVDGYMKFFKAQQISESCHFINRMREEVQTRQNQIAQLNALIAKMEAFDDPGEVFDTLMCLRDDVRVEHAKLMGLNELVTQAEEDIKMNEAQLEVAMVEVCLVLITVFGVCVLRNWMRILSLGVWQRLVAESEVVGEVEGVVKCLEHMRVIVARDAVTLGELETLLGRAHVGVSLKAGFVADMDVKD